MRFGSTGVLQTFMCVCDFCVVLFFKCSHIAQNVSLLVPPLPPSLPPPPHPRPPTVSAVFAVCKMRVVPTLSGMAGTEFAFPFFFFFFFLSFLFLRYYTPWVRDILQYQSLGVSVLLLLFCLFLFFVCLFVFWRRDIWCTSLLCL